MSRSIVTVFFGRVLSPNHRYSMKAIVGTTVMPNAITVIQPDELKTTMARYPASSGNGVPQKTQYLSSGDGYDAQCRQRRGFCTTCWPHWMQ